MQVVKIHRGYERLMHRPVDPGLGRLCMLAEAAREPGYLWLGEDHRLSRAEVRQLIAHLQAWLDTGSLQLPEGKEQRPTVEEIREYERERILDIINDDDWHRWTDRDGGWFKLHESIAALKAEIRKEATNGNPV